MDINIPKPLKTLKVKWSELRPMFAKLGITQAARVDGSWDTSAIKPELRERGWDEDAGPTPFCEEGADAPLDGNQRLTAAAELAEEAPDLYADRKAPIIVYPKLTNDQRQELVNRAARSTRAFTVWDYYKQSKLRWLARPDEDQLQHLIGMGLSRVRQFFPNAIADEFLERGPDGNLRVKAGLKGKDVWAKGKGGNKQGPVQVGKALANAHPRAEEAFFAQRTDPKHSIDYRELIEVNTAWEEDRKIRQDLAVPPATLEVIAKEFPESKLVASVLGKRISEGRKVKPGREEGAGRMSKNDVAQLMTSLNFSQLAHLDYHRSERDPGYVGDEAMRAQEAIHRFVQRCLDQKFDSFEDYKAAAKEASDLMRATLIRASQAAKAHADRVREAEAAKNAGSTEKK